MTENDQKTSKIDRRSEIHNLLSLSPEQIIAKAGERLIVCESIDDLHQQMAQDIYQEIVGNNQQGRRTVLILPVGPTGQYPILTQMLITNRVSLAQCWFFFMDEYCDDRGVAVNANHPLSFKRIAHDLFLDEVTKHGDLDPQRVIFPDEHNIEALPQIIADAGGIDTCYGGIGIHGHVAFNEPEIGVSLLPSRKVQLNDFTVTINAIRSQVGGNLEGFPRYAYTLGMVEILSARQIRLYCRNGIALDWANTVLRLALFGSPGDDYPVTHIREKNYVIITDRDTIQSVLNNL